VNSVLADEVALAACKLTAATKVLNELPSGEWIPFERSAIEAVAESLRSVAQALEATAEQMPPR
jgi:uncharacterized protein Yka (UPF0111/DUF47 family)